MDFRFEDEPIKKRKIKVIILVSIFILLVISLLIYYYFFMNKPVPVKTKKPVVEKKLTIVDENSNKRPIAVMYDNNVGASSHVGLQDSYINYEII